MIQCFGCDKTSGLRKLHNGFWEVLPEYSCEECFRPQDNGPDFSDLEEVPGLQLSPLLEKISGQTRAEYLLAFEYAQRNPPAIALAEALSDAADRPRGGYIAPVYIIQAWKILTTPALTDRIALAMGERS